MIYLHRGYWNEICILGITEIEIELFIHTMQVINSEQKAKLTLYNCLYSFIDVVVTQCGISKVNDAIATQLMIDDFNVDAIIIVGIAGALSKNISIFDTVIASKVLSHDGDKMILQNSQLYLYDGIFRVNQDLLKIAINFTINIQY